MRLKSWSKGWVASAQVLGWPGFFLGPQSASRGLLRRALGVPPRRVAGAVECLSLPKEEGAAMATGLSSAAPPGFQAKQQPAVQLFFSGQASQGLLPNSAGCVTDCCSAPSSSKGQMPRLPTLPHPFLLNLIQTATFGATFGAGLPKSAHSAKISSSSGRPARGF